MKLIRKIYETKAEKRRDFAAGIRLFLAGNALLAGIALASYFLAVIAINALNVHETAALYNTIGTVLGIAALLANIGMLLYAAFTEHWVALGMLSAMAVPLAIVICVGVIIPALCFDI